MASNLTRFAAAAALAMGAGAVSADESIGVVKRAGGDVQIQRADIVLPTAKGTLLRKGDRVITGGNGHVAIAMRGRELNIGPGADVALDRYAPDDMVAAPASRPMIAQGLASLLGMNRHR